MQTHDLTPTHKQKSRRRVGRGGKKGTYSGRGGKGQTARSGRKLVPMIRELIKRYPKLKGYRRFALSGTVAEISLNALEKHGIEGVAITPSWLREKGLVPNVPGPLQVKILGSGTIRKKLSVEGCKASASAKAAIEKAGGTVR